MAQRPQPSLRLADGGSFITRWAQSVMRPNATANRLREADAPPLPPAAPASAPVRAPAPPPPNPNATPDNPAGIRFQDGGHVPGTGRGDKIPAKYEPGEFVVSNDMIDDNPGLREQLSGLRAETLAARGKTVEEADAKALNGGRRPSLRAQAGFSGSADPDFWRGNPNPLQGNQANQTLLDAARQRTDPVQSAAAQAANARAAVPEGAAVRPTAPLPPEAAAAYDASPEGRATKAPDSQRDPRLFPRQPKRCPYHRPPRPGRTGDPHSGDRGAVDPAQTASALGSGLLYGGAGVAGALAAGGLRDAGKGGPAVAVPGERQAGDSATSTQIPTGGYRSAPDARPYNFWTDSEAGRNIGNAANAIAPLGGVAMAARVPGAASKAFGVADAALGGLSAGVHNERASANTATSAAPTLRTRPEGTFAGPPAAAAGAASPATDPGAPRRIDRPGQSPLFTNVADDAPYIGNNALMARGNGPNAQNMAAADNLAARNDITPSLRAQAQYDAEVANAQRINSMQQRMNGAGSRSAQLDLRSPENLAARNASMSSNLDYNRMSRSEIQARTSLAGIEAQKQTAQMQNQTTLRGQDINAETSRYGADASTDASRYGSDNSLRSQMYSSDAQLGAKRMEMQRGLQQQQLKGAIFREAGGKPEVAAQIAASYGLDPKDFTDMASASQTRDHNATTNARKRLEGMAVRSDDKGGTVVDPGRLARLESTLGKMAPGWQHMSEPEQAKHLATAEASVNLLEGLNDRRNNGFWQSIRVDGPSASLDKLPIEAMKGGRLKTVKALEGAFTGGGVERKDYVIETEGGHKLYLPRDKVNQGELELLKSRGVDISSLQK